MTKITQEEVSFYIQRHLTSLHEKQLAALRDLHFNDILRQKNPYLYRARSILHASDLVNHLLSARLATEEETFFGSFLEGLSLFICIRAHGATPCKIKGIDLQFVENKTLYLLTVKAAPQWGDRTQISRMKRDFLHARQQLQPTYPHHNIIAIQGCCHGNENNEDQGEFLKLCGERFWTLISGLDRLYLDLIRPIGQNARARHEEFQTEYARITNKFTKNFIDQFCSSDGLILWDNLVHHLSSSLPRAASRQSLKNYRHTHSLTHRETTARAPFDNS